MIYSYYILTWIGRQDPGHWVTLVLLLALRLANSLVLWQSLLSPRTGSFWFNRRYFSIPALLECKYRKNRAGCRIKMSSSNSLWDMGMEFTQIVSRRKKYLRKIGSEWWKVNMTVANATPEIENQFGTWIKSHAKKVLMKSNLSCQFSHYNSSFLKYHHIFAPLSSQLSLYFRKNWTSNTLSSRVINKSCIAHTTDMMASPSH